MKVAVGLSPRMTMGSLRRVATLESESALITSVAPRRKTARNLIPWAEALVITHNFALLR
jgi:hypothetical protein